MLRWVWKKLGYSDVLVVGAALVDTIVDTDREIVDDKRPGIKFPYGPGRIRNSIGGEAYNISVNLAEPPRKRRDRPLVAIFTYVPSGLELGNIIIRRLKIAGVGTRFVRRIRYVPLEQGKLVVNMGGFVGMRYQALQSGPGPVDVGRVDSIFRFDTLLGPDGERALFRAIRRTKVVVIDSEMSPAIMDTLINSASDAGLPVIIAAMSIAALDVYLQAMPSGGPQATLLSVRRHTIEESWAETHNEHLGLVQRLSTRYWRGAAEQRFEENVADGIVLCRILKTKNVLITQGLNFAIHDASGRVLYGSIVPKKGTVSWHGIRDAICSALVSLVARPARVASVKALDFSFLEGRPKATEALIKNINSYVGQILFSVGATRNSEIDTAVTEHPFLEWYYRARTTVFHGFIGFVVAYVLPALLRILDPNWLLPWVYRIWTAVRRLLGF